MPAQKVERRDGDAGSTCFGWAPGSGHESCRAVVTTAQVPINKFCLWYAFEKNNNNRNNVDNKTRAPFQQEPFGRVL